MQLEFLSQHCGPAGCGDFGWQLPPLPEQVRCRQLAGSTTGAISDVCLCAGA